MSRYDNGSARVAHPRGFVKIPALDDSVDESGREGVARAEDVVHFDGKAGDLHGGFAGFAERRSLFAALYDDGAWSAPLHRLNGSVQIAGNVRAGDLRVGHVHLRGIGNRDGLALI